MSSSQYIRVTQAALSAVKTSHLPLYSCKYSKTTCTRHHLLVLLLLKERLRLDYRSFVDLLAVMPPIRDLLHLDRVPHYTTLHTFLQRIHSLWLTILQKKILSSAHQHGEVIRVAALDASGFTSAYARSSSSARTGKTRKRFLKVALAVDTDKQLILAATVTQHPTHDAALAGDLLKQSHRTRKAACSVMDKGSDAESIHRLIWEDLRADSLIPIRTGKREEIRGTYRRELARSFDTKKYHRRNIAETAFSALKRTLGESLKARTYRVQTKEIKIKLILYNLKRTSTAVGLRIVIELFYRA
ncbi:MAG: IS5 family transposase [Methanomicrobiaceae archaeon]|nr:IS5 family transposase [Methanomicrobiaceae archaeon]